jgi:hypothetical protein
VENAPLNYACIDAQNLNLGIRNLGWRLDYTRFRRYLDKKYKVEVAYMFLGFLPSNQDLYAALQKASFVLFFRPTLKRGQVCKLDFLHGWLTWRFESPIKYR